jgi:hypothetical protein
LHIHVQLLVKRRKRQKHPWWLRLQDSILCQTSAGKQKQLHVHVCSQVSEIFANFQRFSQKLHNVKITFFSNSRSSYSKNTSISFAKFLGENSFKNHNIGLHVQEEILKIFLANASDSTSRVLLLSSSRLLFLLSVENFQAVFLFNFSRLLCTFNGRSNVMAVITSTSYFTCLSFPT